MSTALHWSEMTDIQRNALIAEKVFGRVIDRATTFGRLLMTREDQQELTEEIPHYTTSMDAAWLVVERVTQLPRTSEDPRHSALSNFAMWFNEADLWADTAQEAAKAICIAALRAYGQEIEE